MARMRIAKREEMLSSKHPPSQHYEMVPIPLTDKDWEKHKRQINREMAGVVKVQLYEAQYQTGYNILTRWLRTLPETELRCVLQYVDLEENDEFGLLRKKWDY